MPVMETFTSSKPKENVPSWALRNESFNGDELIEAYIKGCNEGVVRFKKVLIKKLEQNIWHTQELGSKFIAQLNKDNFICKSAHMKYLDIEKYKIIFVINHEIYYDYDKMEPIYAMADAFEEHESNDDFDLEISFIPEVKSLNPHRLMSDGFIFHYDGE